MLRNPYNKLNSEFLEEKGLNLQAVFDLEKIKDDIELDSKLANQYSQMIVFAHGGKQLWQSLQSKGAAQSDPVDNYSIDVVEKWFSQTYGNADYEILYPLEQSLNLCRLGKLAGWHHSSPFKIGINYYWGSWFAYRVVVLANTQLQVSDPIIDSSPCTSCTNKVCIQVCPASAVQENAFSLNACVGYRKHPDSNCKATCLSRVSCPIAVEHKYSAQQLAYHYQISLQSILTHSS